MKNLNLNLNKKLSENSNTVLSSQRALKSYIDDKRIILDFLQDTTPTTFIAGNKWLNTSNLKLYIATSSSAWDSGTNITTGEIYSFNNLLYYYDGTNLVIYSTKSIVDMNSGNETKVWFGTQNEYDNLSSYDPNTTYNIIDNASTLSTLLATQQEFNSSAQDKAATPYQVQNLIAGYLPLSGGTLNAGATLSFKNTNNGTNTLSFDTNNVLNITNNLTVSNNITANNIIATSGNIYKTSISGETVVWSNTLNNYLPLSGGTLTGETKFAAGLKLGNSSVDSVLMAGGADFVMSCRNGAYFQGNNETATNVYIRKSSGYSIVQTASDKAVANGLATLDANAQIVRSQIPFATSSDIGGIMVSFDGNTGTLNIVTE